MQEHREGPQELRVRQPDHPGEQALAEQDHEQSRPQVLDLFAELPSRNARKEKQRN